MKKTFITLFGVLLSAGLSVFAQEHPLILTDTTSVKVYFRQGYSNLDPLFRDNGTHLDSLAAYLRAADADTLRRVKTIHIVGAASPEGSTKRNMQLSEQRAASIMAWLRSRLPFPESTYVSHALAEDWQGLEALVEASDMPWRDEVLNIIRNTPVWIVRDGKVVDGRKRQLGMLRGGEPWRYMESRFFPELRSSASEVLCEIVRVPPADTVVVHDTVQVVRHDTLVLVRRDTVYVPTAAEKKPFYMAVKTNMLYDALLVPNIGAEFYLGKGWTVGADWMYAWWSNDSGHRYWRVYGGDLMVRKYFGRKAEEKPLTGHHLGLYGQMLTYDFEWGGTGYLGDRWSWGVGVEYGYSMPVARRLNIDFSIGVGYLGGEYKVYEPMDGHYVWQKTRQRRWFGPMRADISLVWLLGYGNYNKDKGGSR